MGQKTMKKASRGLNLRSIFRYMMEEGYYPTFENSHILFEIEGTMAIVEYEEGILAIRLFFSLEEEDNNILLASSNATMMETYIVKPIVLEDYKSLMFSCETFCETLGELKRFFPKGILLLTEAINEHKSQTRQFMLARSTVQSFTDTNKTHNLLS